MQTMMGRESKCKALEVFFGFTQSSCNEADRRAKLAKKGPIFFLASPNFFFLSNPFCEMNDVNGRLRN